MSYIYPMTRVKLIINLLVNNKKIFKMISNDFESIFGSIDLISTWFYFKHTTYYYKEMGCPLYRRILVFKNLVNQVNFVDFKLISNLLEDKYSITGKRLINIDPGYVSSERFVLFTGKNYLHRIHIGCGVYADLTLIYKDGFFCELPWTYEDYSSSYLKKFFLIIRNKYLNDLKLNFCY